MVAGIGAAGRGRPSDSRQDVGATDSGYEILALIVI